MDSGDSLTCNEERLLGSNKQAGEETMMRHGESGTGRDKAEEDDEPPCVRSTDGDCFKSQSSAQCAVTRPCGLAENPCFSSCGKLAAIVGAGLENLGNTCFLNAVMQCFIHTVPLLHGIFSNKHSNCDKEKFCLICVMRWLTIHSLTKRNEPVAPFGLVDNLSYFSSGFKRFRQEDAHEFLQCFLDRLESCYEYSQSDNIVNQIFGGLLVSKLKCCSCGHCSDTYEPSIDLSLEIEDVDNLSTALQSFTKVEKIEDPETKFTCENCKEKVSVEMKLSFDQLPSVALFQLKRFKNDGCLVHKIDKHIAFPLVMDLQPFTSGGHISCVKLKYVLYAVVVHVGLTSTSGHYYCFIRLSPDTWCKFDDSRVVPVPEEYVLSQEAYILYYANENTSWFSTFIEAQQYFSLDPKSYDTSPKSVLDRVLATPLSPKPKIKSHPECYRASFDIGHSNEAEDAGLMHENSKVNENPIDDRCGMSSIDTPPPEAPVEKSAKFREKLHELIGEACSRSPSPEIYREDPPDASFLIPSYNRKMVACKRKLEEDMDDLETKQAYSFIKKSMHGSRGQQMMAALRGTKFGAPKSRRSGRGGSSIGPVARPLTAGPHR